MKCATSSGMSSSRSRSGGTKIGITLRRKKRSSRKRPARISAVEVLVGGREHAHVHAHAVVPAHRVHDLLLQHAQHLGLRLEAHVADLVEKDRAVVGQLEAPAPVRHGAGERPAHVAEQLALDQLLGDRRAVDLDEGPAAAPAQRVDAARHQFLARAVLAEDQHPAVGRRRHGDLLAQRSHDVALAHHHEALVDVLAQRRGSPPRAAAAGARCAPRAASCRWTAASRRNRTRPSSRRVRPTRCCRGPRS